MTRQQALLRQQPALKCSPKCKGERLQVSPSSLKCGPAVHTVITLRYFYPFPNTTALLCYFWSNNSSDLTGNQSDKQ